MRCTRPPSIPRVATRGSAFIACWFLGMSFFLACHGEESDQSEPLSGDILLLELIVENATPRILPLAQMWLAVPPKHAAEHRNARFEVTQAYDEQQTGNENRRIRMDWTDVPVGLKENVIVRVGLDRSVGDAVELSEADTEPYTRPIADIDSIDPEKVAGWASSPSDATVSQILSWVREQGAMTTKAAEAAEVPATDRVDEEPSIDSFPVALSGTESLPDPVWIAVSALRSAGMPARVVAGFVASEEGLLRASAFELWIEVYLDGRWQSRRISGANGSTERLVTMRVLAEPSDWAAGMGVEGLVESFGLKVTIL